MKKELTMNKKESFIFNIFGIFIDYLIDTNRFNDLFGPEYNWDNCKDWKNWEVSKIEIQGIPYLILDLKVLSFSYCKYIRQEKRVLKNGLDRNEAIDELMAYSKLLGLEILNQPNYYMTGIPQGIEF